MNGATTTLVVVAAAVFSAAVILLLLPWLRRHALAQVNARSSHRLPTPQGGGIAVIVATVIVCLVAAVLGISDAALLGPVFIAAPLIALVGATDDIWTLPVAPRLVLQAVATSLMIASLPAELRVVPILPWWMERVLLLVACLWFVNLANFMDGIDWMTVVEFVPLTAALALLGAIGALPVDGLVVALALCGGLIGFAPFNKPAARIFLGDVGSLPIGLLVAWLLVLLASRGHLAAAVIMPLYYLADATITLGRRIANREPFWLSHRSHFYQRATDLGFTVTEIVARVFCTNLMLIALATATVLWPTFLVKIVALVLAAAIVGRLLYVLARRK